MTASRSIRRASFHGPAPPVPALPGVRHRLGRREHLALGHERGDSAYLLESGCLLVEARLPDDRRQIALALFPGDIISRNAVPPLPGIVITASVPSVVVRVGDGAAESPHDPDGRSRTTHFARLAARYAMQAIALNRLSAEERLATLLLELTLRLGRPAPRGCAVELPMSRSDMAHFVGLNPDTLSRLMSRLKAAGVLSTAGRGHLTVHSAAGVAARTPLAKALLALNPEAPCAVASETPANA